MRKLYKAELLQSNGTLSIVMLNQQRLEIMLRNAKTYEVSFCIHEFLQDFTLSIDHS